MDVLPGFRHRSATRMAAIGLGILVLLVPSSRGQDHSDEDKNTEKKHYLTFQVSYRGSAQESSGDEFGKRERMIDVNTRFSGRIEVRPSEAYDLPTSPEAQMKRAAEIQAAVLAGDVDKLKQATPASLVTWFPVGDQVELTATISETSTLAASKPELGESRASSDRTTERYRGQKVFPGNFGNAFVKIRAEEKKYDLQFMLMPDMAETMEAVRQTITTEHREEGNNRHKEEEGNVPLDMGPNQLGLGYSNYQIVAEAKGMPLAGEANELIGHTLIPVPKPANWKGSWDIVLDVSWQIDVTLPPLELVITAEGYDDWRPEGNIKKPAEPGNHLVTRATLKPKGSEGKFVPRVEHIRFELMDTSREPGICLNWPLGAKDADYDLRLVAVSGGTLSKKDQALEVSDPRRNEEGHTYAEAQIDSYDFGGRASLRVTCLLADGREIEGTLDGEEMPRIPRMKGPGWIADSWRKAKGVPDLPDNDDDEEVKGQKHNGDGFTLYEEYRGWAENGKHIEGDPKRKDFFILNRIGLNAQPGIELFEQLSELRVHSKLRLYEMSPVDRLMNGNRRDAPWRVAQHGVWVKTFTREELGDNGADTPLTKTGVAGRPGIAKGVGILARNNPESIFNQPFNLPVQDAIFAYDRAIAHELLHSVGVEHHGPADKTGYALVFVPPNVPRNKIGRPHYQTDDGTPFTLLTEDGHDVAAMVYPNYARTWAQATQAGLLDMMIASWTKSLPDSSPAEIRRHAEDNVRSGFDQVYQQKGILGREHAEHSGNQDCVMRYYFASFYEARGKANTLYVVKPGTERIGLEICRARTGTGINAASPSRQSRYGDAAAGDCFSQICPNDAIPPDRSQN
jgi:hypothetical protein